MKQIEDAVPTNPFIISSESLDGFFTGSGAGESFTIATNFGPNIVNLKIKSGSET